MSPANPHGLRQQLVQSVANECGAARPVAERPADRRMLMATLVGRISSICRGYSMPDDANQAMLHICDALADYHRERANSFAAEDGPFSSTFSVYADEARENAAEITASRKRWEATNVSELMRSVSYLLGHLCASTKSAQREHVYAASRAIEAAQQGVL